MARSLPGKHLEEKDEVDVGPANSNEPPAESARVVDHIAERQLCRKFDVRLMPVLAIMC